MPPMEPLMLHARAVTLPLYAKRDPIRVRAPVPEHMHADLMACGFDVAKDTVEALKAKPQSQAKPKS
jgi:hypothetical protein